MFTTILAITATLAIALAVAFLCCVAFRALGLAEQIHQHQMGDHLTRMAISTVITGLHNGEDLDPFTLEHAIQVIQLRLTDILLGNGYDVRDWNPRPMINATLANSGLLYHLTRALDKRRKLTQCPDSITSSKPTTPPQSASTGT